MVADTGMGTVDTRLLGGERGVLRKVRLQEGRAGDGALLRSAQESCLKVGA